MARNRYARPVQQAAEAATSTAGAAAPAAETVTISAEALKVAGGGYAKSGVVLLKDDSGWKVGGRYAPTALDGAVGALAPTIIGLLAEDGTEVPVIWEAGASEEAMDAAIRGIHEKFSKLRQLAASVPALANMAMAMPQVQAIKAKFDATGEFPEWGEVVAAVAAIPGADGVLNALGVKLETAAPVYDLLTGLVKADIAAVTRRETAAMSEEVSRLTAAVADRDAILAAQAAKIEEFTPAPAPAPAPTASEETPQEKEFNAYMARPIGFGNTRRSWRDVTL
jgi:hypothetical protein